MDPPRLGYKDPAYMGGAELQAAAREIRLAKGLDPDQPDPAHAHLSVKDKIALAREVRERRLALMAEVGIEPQK
jgi:hypothetical protein